MSAVTNLQASVTDDFTLTDFPSGLLSGEAAEFTLTYKPSKVDLMDVNTSVSKNAEGEIVVSVRKEFKGLLKITGEFMKVEESET